MDFFRPGIVEGAGAYAREHGLHLDARWSVRADWMPLDPGWDGVILQFVDMVQTHERLVRLGLPQVNLDVSGGHDVVVTTDYGACGRMALEEFLTCGYRVVCSVTSGTTPLTRLACDGFFQAAVDASVQVFRLGTVVAGDALSAGAVSLAEEMAALPKPCGFFMPHAGIAFSVLDAFRERGLRVPQDVGIIVIDKDAQRTSELAAVPLTGVVPDDWQQGYEAAATVHELLRGRMPEQQVRLIKPLAIHRRDSTGITTSRDPVVIKALHLIRGPQGLRLSIDQLVASAAVARRSLEVRFRKETGLSLHEAMMNRRIEAAKRLLAATNDSILGIADACGFSSVHYFTTVFKRETGSTPGAWRHAYARK